MDTIRDMIADERGALAEVLASLSAARWDEPSLFLTGRKPRP
jgi:hypothetical protein